MQNTGTPHDFHYWINRKSLFDMTEMTSATFKVFEMVRRPILIAFVDFEHEKKSIRDASIKVVEILKKVAPTYFHGIIFAYANNLDYKHTRKTLGITHNKIPALSINSNEQRVTPFPEDVPLSKKGIHEWVDKYFRGELDDKREQFGEIEDFQIKYSLSGTLMLTRQAFIDQVYAEGTDYIVFVYSSAKENDIQRYIASSFNRLAEAVSNENIETLVVASYDVNTENFPPMMESQEVPMIYFYPAYRKRPPFKKFLAEPKAS